MLRTCCVCCDIRKADACACYTGKLNLCLFCSFTDSLHSHFVVCDVNAVFLLELVNNPLGNTHVEVVAAETVVTCCSKNLYNAVTDFKDRDVEGTAAEVVNHNLLVRLLVETVSKSGSCRLIDDTENLKTCNLTCVLCCLTLAVRKVCRNGDNRLRNLCAEIAFGICLEL